MQRELHFRGVWFLPDDKKLQVPGILDYSPNKGVDLQLLGVLGKSESIIDGDLSVICGITSDGKKITLYKCYPYHRGFSSNGLENSSYEALYMFVGLLIPTEELKFKYIKIHFQDFDRWLNIFGFKRNEFNKENRETFVEYKQPNDLSFAISNDAQCDFKFSTYAPYITKVSSLTIKQVCEVSLSWRGQVKQFETLFNLFQTFQMFLTLSYFERPLIKRIVLGKEVSANRHDRYDAEVELYFRSDITKDTYKERDHSKRFLFTYNDVRENFQTILFKWFEAEASLSPTIYGLSEAFSKNKTAIEFSFLNIAHAIETLHRRRRTNFVLPNKEYKTRVEEIISSVNPEHSSWLKAKLEFGNEPTLHERLEELISELPANVKTVLLKPSPSEFLKNFKRSRNYYTHYNPSLEKKALKGGDLFYLKETSKILLICIVLKEIGFSDTELEKLIFNKGVFLFNHIIKYEELRALYQYCEW
jgi:hypothetical protein